eukprot:514652_1
MAATDHVVSDEEYARQLQQEEFGSLLPGSYFAPRSTTNNNNNPSIQSQDISAPLLNENNNINNNQPNPLLNNINLNNNGDANNNNANNQNVNIGNAAQRA